MGLMEEVEVRTTSTGVPLAVVRSGRVWTVGAPPVRWYERRPWWLESPRMPAGGTARIDIEIWQVQVRPHRPGNAPLVTLELIHHREDGTWQVRSEDATG
jgi:hypothetical protein